MKLQGALLLSLLSVFTLTITDAHARERRVSNADIPPIQEAQPTQESVEVPPDAINPQPSIQDVINELTELRKEVAQLHELLDARISNDSAELRIENERLRKELETRKNAPAALPMPDKELLKGLSDPNVIRPRGQKQTLVPQEPETPPEKEFEQVEQSKQSAKNESAPPLPQGEFKHEVFAEWGRSPSDAAKSIPKIGSLKGMICIVPPGASDEQLTTLARSLHKEFATYDNINIEVFDDTTAAKAFKENRGGKGNNSPSEHRVLSISKHGASGRDVILLIKGEQIEEIPPQE
jgi:hypothetical protein